MCVAIQGRIGPYLKCCFVRADAGETEGDGSLVDMLRVQVHDLPTLKRIVVAIDQNASSEEDSNECGIICAGLGADGHGYVLDDVSGVLAPHEWATTAISLLHERVGDRIIAETNNGGEMVEQTFAWSTRAYPSAPSGPRVAR